MRTAHACAGSYQIDSKAKRRFCLPHVHLSERAFDPSADAAGCACEQSLADIRFAFPHGPNMAGARPITRLKARLNEASDS